MAKVRIKATKADVEKAGQDQGDFILPKIGLYVMNLDACNPGLSKGDDGNEDPKRERLELILSFVGIGSEESLITENYGKVWDYVSMSDAAGWKRAEFGKAFGLIPPDHSDDFDMNFDTDDIVNYRVLVRIKHETQGKGKDATKRAKVARMYLYGSNPEAVESTSTDYGTAASAADKSKEFDSAAESEQTDEPYTVYELVEQTLKDLGAILKEEFGTDPNTLIVKNSSDKLDAEKTKTAVIKAILDAQNAAAPADDSDKENPF